MEQRDILFKETTALMRRLGIPPNIDGYEYIREAIILLVNRTSSKVSIMRSIYAPLSEKHNRKINTVERTIRHAKQKAWEFGDKELLDEMFRYVHDMNKGFPANSLFLSQCAEYVRLKIVEDWLSGAKKN